MSGRGDVKIEIGNRILGACEIGEIAAGEYVHIAATDLDSNMDEETMGQVFESFFTTKRVGEGTVLGQIFGFVRQSGCDIWIDSIVAGLEELGDMVLACTGGRKALATLVERPDVD